MKFLLAIALGGALGATSRFLLSDWVNRLTAASPFPFGTLVVNVVGSFFLGVLFGLDEGILPGTLRSLLSVGFLGAITTFSTFSLETVVALEDGRADVALANVGANVVLSLGACWLGIRVAS